MWVYLNNQFVEDDQAKVSIFDRGFLFGDGIFETLRIYKGQPLFLDRHLQRLHHSCEALALILSTPEPAWEMLLHELVERNHLEHALVRITISRGVGGLGPDPTGCLTPTIVIFPRPLPQLTKDQREQGVSIAIVNTRRQPSCALPTQVKSLNYLNNILAKQEAVKAQTFDGLMLNTDGHIAECTTSNIFFVKDQCLYTPSLQCGILPGITREIVLELAQTKGIAVQEGTYEPKDLLDADEGFLTNTGFGILPVSKIDSRQLKSAKQGTETQIIQLLYESHIAKSC